MRLSKTARLGVWLVMLALSSTVSLREARADVTPDRQGGNTRVRREGNRIDIDGGRVSRDGRNLFHSFERFGINSAEVANFLSRPEIRNILGRVTGGDPSVINGLLRVSGGNSNLYLMNPAGIVFGRSARLDVPGSFTATTANGIGFGNSWFNAVGSNNYEALVGDPNGFAFTMNQPGSIVNFGELSVPEGQELNFWGGTVINLGKLSAPGGEITVSAVPGERMIRLSQEGMVLQLEIPVAVSTDGTTLPNGLPFNPLTLPQLLTVGAEPASGVAVNPNSSVTLTPSGTVVPSEPGTAIASGTLDVSCTTGACPAQAGLGGSIDVLGERVGLVSANLNASGANGGGAVRVGGDYQGNGTVPNAERTFVSADSLINADALESGNGGRVIVWADGRTEFSGNVSARGGFRLGDGGFAEVSGKESLAFQGLADLRAPNGTQGTLLLDPTDITITTAPTTATTGAGPIFQDSTTSLSNISNADLQNQLALGNVTVTTASGLTGLGNITVDAPVNWTSPSSLTLRADRSITVNQPITSTSGNITLEANTAGTSTGNFAGILIGSTVRSETGTINFTGVSGNGDATDQNYGILIDGRNRAGLVETTGSGSITLRGTSNGSDLGGQNDGVSVLNTSVRSTGGGSINIFGSGNGAGNTNDAQSHGIRLEASTITATGREIILTGDSNNVAGSEGIFSQDTVISQGSSNLENQGRIVIRTDSFDFTGSTTIRGSRSTLQVRGLSPNLPITLSALGGDITPGLNINVIDLVRITGISEGIIGQDSNIILNLPRSGNFVVGREIPFPFPITLRGATIRQTGGALRTTGSAPIRFEARQINLRDIFNPGQSIEISSTGTIRTGELSTRPSVRNRATEPRNRDGGTITLSATGSITTDRLDSSSPTRDGGRISVESRTGSIQTDRLNSDGGRNGGDIQLSAQSGRIRTDNISSFGDANGGNVRLEARDSITAGQINSSGFDDGGDVTLDPSGDVEFSWINSEGITGRGGDVEITSTDGFVRATGSFSNRNERRASISTADGEAGGDITIRHGGRGRTSFDVGNADRNGTAEAITTGRSTIAPSQSFPYTYTQDNIRIITANAPIDPNTYTPPLNQPLNPAVGETLAPPPIEIGLLDGTPTVDFPALEISASSDYQNYLGLLPGSVRIRTLSEAQRQLQEVEQAAGIKPALIYVFFTPPGGGSGTPVDAETSQIQLDNDLLELELVLVTTRQQPVRIPLRGVTRQQVLETVTLLRETVADPTAEKSAYLPPSEQMYRWLIQPLKAKLDEQQIDTIAFVMDSGLRTIPIAALSDPGADPNSFDDNRYLAEYYSLGLMPSLSLTQADFKGVKDAQVLAMGTSEFARYNLPELPAVPIELRDIATQIWDGQILQDQNFTTRNLRAEQQTTPFGIVHLATHAVVADGLDNSFVVFSDRALPFSEFRSLDLSGVELLVLSACRTAQDSREVELGFAGLAIQAGVKTALGSLWKVSDAGTLALMTEFYKNLREAPIKARALQEAQIKLLSGPVQVTDLNQAGTTTVDFTHPAYWAAFTVIGSPW